MAVRSGYYLRTAVRWRASSRLHRRRILDLRRTDERTVGEWLEFPAAVESRLDDLERHLETME